MKTFMIAVLFLLLPTVSLTNDRLNNIIPPIRSDDQRLTENYVQRMEQDTTHKVSRNNIEDNVNKSPAKAIIIALIPGSIVRGAGHIYVKRYKTAALLFTFSAIPIAIAMSNPYGGTEEEGNFFGLLFFGSWIYDIIASPIICHRLNKMARHSSITPYFRKNHMNKDEIGIKYSYIF